MRVEVFERDGWRCWFCGKAGALEAHHTIRGGGLDPFDMAFIVSACRTCHVRETRRERERDGRSAEHVAWDALVKSTG